MAGSDLVFNIAKGKVTYYAGLPAAADALILVPIETTSIETDATLKDYDDLAALIAGTSNEQTTIGRKTISSATITVDDTNDRVDIDIADQAYVAPTGNAVGKFLVCYDGDTGAGTDSNITPLTAHAVSWTPDGNDANIVINASGFFRAS